VGDGRSQPASEPRCVVSVRLARGARPVIEDGELYVRGGDSRGSIVSAADVTLCVFGCDSAAAFFCGGCPGFPATPKRTLGGFAGTVHGDARVSYVRGLATFGLKHATNEFAGVYFSTALASRGQLSSGKTGGR